MDTCSSTWVLLSGARPQQTKGITAKFRDRKNLRRATSLLGRQWRGAPAPREHGCTRHTLQKVLRRGQLGAGWPWSPCPREYTRLQRARRCHCTSPGRNNPCAEMSDWRCCALALWAPAGVAALRASYGAHGTPSGESAAASATERIAEGRSMNCI